MDIVYSYNFLLKIKDLDECKIKHKSLNCIDLSIFIEKHPINIPSANAYKIKDINEKTDIEEIKLILNKLNKDNISLLIKQTQNIKYTNPDIVSIIFKSAVLQPYYSEVFANYCLGLKNIHKYIKDLCFQEYSKLKKKELIRFIGHLYKLNIINDNELNLIIDDLSDICENNLEILLELTIIIDVTKKEFNNIINKYNDKKNIFSKRHKFMIMDLTDYHNGIRKPSIMIRKEAKY